MSAIIATTATTATAASTTPKFNHRNQKQSQEQGYNGEPGCQTLEEVNQMFRNFWDPTSYWKCEAVGQTAKKTTLSPITAILGQQSQVHSLHRMAVD